MRDTKKPRNAEPALTVQIHPTIGEHWLLTTGVANLPAPNWSEGADRLRLMGKLLDGATFEETLADPPPQALFRELITAPIFLDSPEARLAIRLIDQIVGLGRVTVYQLGFFVSLKERLEQAIDDARKAAITEAVVPGEPGPN